jgi:crossover junction endodeoxyribonuclease RusA
MTEEERSRRVAHTGSVLAEPLRSTLPLITIEVFGLPRPQGSLALFKAKAGHTVAKYGQAVYEWRGTVTTAVRETWAGPVLSGPLAMSVLFELPRSKGHFGTGRNAGVLRPSAPPYPDGMPDLDKLQRAVFDAITDAGTVWHDDAQVVRVTASKAYVKGDSVPGCTMRITPVAT